MAIRDFPELYEKMVEDRPILGSFLSGHLAIEYLLRKLISIYDPALTKISDDLTHARLIDLNYDIGTINQTRRDVLRMINKMRNKFAHEISYQPKLDDLKQILLAASLAFTDLTDGIAQGLEALHKAQHIKDLDSWVISELFIQISYDLHEEYERRGGDAEIF